MTIHMGTVIWSLPTEQLNITVEPDQNAGWVSPEPGNHWYNLNDIVILEAGTRRCFEGYWYNFDHWTGPVANSNATKTTIAMNGGNKEVTAVFTSTGQDCGGEINRDGKASNRSVCCL